MSINLTTLWDLFAAGKRSDIDIKAKPAPLPAKSPQRLSMRDRYDALVIEMKSTYNLRVRKWRTSTSGCAWEVHYRDGTISRLIESPYPTGPMSCAVFLHEVGHHAIGLRTFRPRCLEEYHAWMWALREMRERKINVTKNVEKRVHGSLHYALRKAIRRGLKNVPAELIPYLSPYPHSPRGPYPLSPRGPYPLSPRRHLE